MFLTGELCNLTACTGGACRFFAGKRYGVVGSHLGCALCFNGLLRMVTDGYGPVGSSRCRHYQRRQAHRWRHGRARRTYRIRVCVRMRRRRGGVRICVAAGYFLLSQLQYLIF